MRKLSTYIIMLFSLFIGEQAMANVKENPDTNKQIISDIYANFAKGDMAASLALMDEKIEWVHPEHAMIPFGKTYYGRDGVAEFFSTAMANIDVLDQQVFQLLADEDKVVAVGYEKMRVKETGITYESNWIHMYTFKNGNVVKFEEFIDTADMVEAFTGSTK